MSNSNGSMKLQIFREGEWRTLRTAEGEGQEKDYKYLHGQMNDWQQNHWELGSCEFRIGYDGWRPTNDYMAHGIGFHEFDGKNFKTWTKEMEVAS